MAKAYILLYAALVFFSLVETGCVTRSDYEIHLFMDKGTQEATGYVKIDGKKHLIRGNYDK